MDILETGPSAEESGITLILAHGAGAPMDSEFMEQVSLLYAERNVRVVRFEFPYMQERRVNGKKRPPDRAPKLLACWAEVVAHISSTSDAIFIGGKSMGGRMATLLLADSELLAGNTTDIKGCVCFGYPYHAPGKPEKIRNEHFSDVSEPILILQGERDAFGTKEEVDRYELFSDVHHYWLKDGNHDLKPRKVSGVTHEQNIIDAVEHSVEWMKRQVS